MKGFLQEYGIIMVVVAVVLGMLTFGKTGYAKGIQDAILGSANHIVETGENVVPKSAKASDIIEIEGTKYIVLEERENNQALVMTVIDVSGYIAFQKSYDEHTYLRPDGQSLNIYEGSEIDNYLENEWYNSLSSTMKVAIQSTNIKQSSYTRAENTDSKQETGPNGQVYNTISRHVFLPSVSEIGKVVDLKNHDKTKAFSKGVYAWTRDSCQDYSGDDGVVRLSAYGGFCWCMVQNNSAGARPTFVIDLSKVDYTEVGHVDYK